MDYCPVFVQIPTDLSETTHSRHQETDILSNEKAQLQFCLQVWSKGGKLVFSKDLGNGSVTHWGISNQYFLFMVNTEENLNIVDLKNENDLISVQFKTLLPHLDGTNIYLAFQSNRLWIADEDTLMTWSYNSSNKFFEQPLEILLQYNFNLEINKAKIFGLYVDKDEIIVVTEVKGALNFSVVHIKNGNEYDLLLYKEILLREEVNQQQKAIQQLKVVFVVKDSKSILVAVVLYDNGSVDFYYDGSLVESSRFFDATLDGATITLGKPSYIDLTFDHVYLKFQSYQVKQARENLISKDVLLAISFQELENKMKKKEFQVLTGGLPIERIFLDKLKLYCMIFAIIHLGHIFTGHCLIETTMFISHGKNLSLYSLVYEKWMKHFQFDDEIISIFRSGYSNWQVKVLLRNQQIHIIDKRENSTSNELLIKLIQLLHCNPLDKALYNSSRIKQAKKLSKMKLIGQGQKAVTKSPINQVVLVLINKKMNGYYIQQRIKINSKSLHLILIEKINCMIQAKLFKSMHKLQVIFLFDFLEDSCVVSLFQSVSLNTMFAHYNSEVLGIYEMIFTAGTAPEIKSLKQIQLNNQKLQLTHGLIKEHSQTNDKYLVLADTTNFYLINLTTDSLVVINDINCVGLYFSDNQYIYALQSKGYLSFSLNLYDIEILIKSKNSKNSYPLLKYFQIGSAGHIDVSFTNARLTFLQSNEILQCSSFLHRNTVAFIGMLGRENYLATKQIGDKFVALSTNGRLSVWNIFSGMRENVQNQKDFSEITNGFEVYQSKNEEDRVYRNGWYTKVLLKQKASEVQVSNQNWQSLEKNCLLLGQKSFLEKLPKTFYRFRVIEITDIDKISFKEFIHPLYTDIQQYIFISADSNKVYEQVMNDKHYVYNLSKQKNGDIILTQKQQLRNVPQDLIQISEYPVIFSPNFTKYLDYSYQNNEFIVREIENEDCFSTIPSQCIQIFEESILDFVKRFKWITDNQIMIINKYGIEQLISLTKEQEKYEFTYDAFNVIPLYEREINKDFNVFYDKPSHRIFDCLKRLKNKYQQYKSAYYLFKEVQSSKNSNIDNKMALSQYYLNQVMYSIDYKIPKVKEMFYVRYTADLSFTFLHWNIIEQLKQGTATLDQYDHTIIEYLLLNILPNGNTILHELAFSNNGKQLEQLMQLAHWENNENCIKYHMPLLCNFEEESVLDIFFRQNSFAFINVLLKYLQLYGIDHHSREIVKILTKLVKENLAISNLKSYFDSRLLQTDYVKFYPHGKLNQENEYSIISTYLWETNDIKNLFAPIPVFQEVKLQYIDIPKMVAFDQEGANFFNALASNEDVDLFSSVAIEKIIYSQWKLVQEYTIRLLFVPFLIFFSLYLVYSHYCIPQRKDNNAHVFLSVPMMVFCMYLLILETFQLKQQGKQYFCSFWNYLDLYPLVGIPIFVGMALTDFLDSEYTAVLVSFQASIGVCIWLKLLYFLRIFDETGYLIRMISEVLLDMRYFILILLLICLAFGDAVQIINQANDDPFLEGGYFGGLAFMFKLTLGDFETSNFGDIAVPAMWVLFVGCAVLNLIVLLNLIISIISESFARVMSVAKQTNLQEKAKIISDNLFLVPAWERNRPNIPHKYLLTAVDVNKTV